MHEALYPYSQAPPDSAHSHSAHHLHLEMWSALLLPQAAAVPKAAPHLLRGQKGTTDVHRLVCEAGHRRSDQEGGVRTMNQMQWWTVHQVAASVKYIYCFSNILQGNM